MKKPERIKRNKDIKDIYLSAHGEYEPGKRVDGSDFTIKGICKKYDLTSQAVYLILKS